MIKNILFDLGEVVAYYDPMPVVEDMCRVHGVEDKTDYYKQAIWGWLKQWDVGCISDIYPKTMDEFPEDKELIEVFSKRWIEGYNGNNQATIAMSERLVQKGYDLFYASNWHKDGFDMVAPQMEPFLSLTKGGVISGDIGIAKPDPSFWQTLLDRYDLRAEESLFIDDREENIEAARSLGMAVFHFTSPEQAEEEVEALLSSYDAA